MTSHRTTITSNLVYMPSPIIYVTLCTLLVVMTTPGVSTQSPQLNYTVEEERAPGTPLGNVLQDASILDLLTPEEVSDLRFTIMKKGNSDASYLDIDQKSGELRTFSSIDRESVCPNRVTCELNVQTVVNMEIGSFFRIIDVKVTVLDINDHAPTFVPDVFNLSIPEDERVGSVFRLPTALDQDKSPGSGSISYYSDAALGSPFTLLTSTPLSLRLDTPLDRETSARYTLLVEAYDEGAPSLTGTLTLNVLVGDVNDNPPIFDQAEYSLNISESTQVGTILTTVRATDRDSNSGIRYVMTSGQEDQVVFTLFDVSPTNGDVTTLVPLDLYAGRTYRLHVEARDGGVTAGSASTTVLISVLDTHNSDPEILLNVFGVNQQAQVSEKASLGKPVAHVQVSDPDSRNSPNGQVKCELDSAHFKLQALDVDRFKVVLTSTLDRETQAFHSVTVTCEDSGSPPKNVSASFLVEVTDENDNKPVFDSNWYSTDVTEGPGNTDDVLVRVHATDADQGFNSQLTYRLAPGADSDFGILIDGSLMVTNTDGVDREDSDKGSVRELVVLAVDAGSPPQTGTATVVVSVRDVNDNPPVFSRPGYQFAVREDASEDTIVSSVAAADSDLEDNAIFYFKMADAFNGMVPFEVSLDGVISVTGPLDREAVPTYNFKIVAFDQGQPTQLSSTVNVHLKVLDINDNSPVFVFPAELNHTLHVPHTLSPNTAFGNILAEDRDTGNNGKLIYARDSGNGTKYFDIDEASGQVLLIRQLSLSDLGTHALTVVAHDLGSDSQMATQAILHVVIYEGNATSSGLLEEQGFRNIVVVVVLVVVTSVLGIAILLTILLIKRVDKQRRQYHGGKTEPDKTEMNRHHMQLASVSDVEASGSLSDVTDAGGKLDSVRKKKEVSFSLEDNSQPPMTTFTPIHPDKYDPIPDRENRKNNELILSNNHYQADRNVKVTGSMKKDVNSFTFHQVHPDGVRQHNGEAPHHHDDNLSDVSGDVSTSDSGRGGSDVELHSHGGTSKDSGDTSFASQRGFTGHNNLSLNTGRSAKHLNAPTKSQGYSSHAPYPRGSGRGFNKTVHFQNIRPEPSGVGTFLSPTNSLPPLPPHVPSSGASPRPSTSRYTPNLYADYDDGGSYVKLSNANHNSNQSSNQNSNHTSLYDTSQGGRRSNPSNLDLERHRSQQMSDRGLVARGHGMEYVDMGAGAMDRGQRSNSNSCLDGTNGWDGDTTTSGSYTVDPVELCDEIDKLFFEENKDVVV